MILQLVLAKVDANEEKNRDLATQFDVKGFPTIKIMRNEGKDVQEYNGPWRRSDIVEYLKKQSGPASSEIKSQYDATSFIEIIKLLLVGIFPKFSGEEFKNQI
ncbi:hypothetical protein K1719_036402 [Acacia pycnantha]|nr:hypothetical protein K1719_036402 [Acacia pycnantha]